jgi:hypothetical protein
VRDATMSSTKARNDCIGVRTIQSGIRFSKIRTMIDQRMRTRTRTGRHQKCYGGNPKRRSTDCTVYNCSASSKSTSTRTFTQEKLPLKTILSYHHLGTNRQSNLNIKISKARGPRSDGCHSL